MWDGATPETPQEQPQETAHTDAVTSGPSVEPPVENPSTQGALAPGGTTDPTPKRKAAGRPHGAKDRLPRTRRPPVQVRAEPLASVPEVDNRVESIPIEEPPPPPPPPSPRSMLRETARHMVNLRNMVDNQRRAKIHEEFSSKLLSWPIG